MASSCCFPDIWAWIHNLPPTAQWPKKSMSICLCTSGSIQPSLNFSVINSNLPRSLISFTIFADFKLPVTLWSSRAFELNTRASDVVDEGIISGLFRNFVTDILKYGPCHNTAFLRIPAISTIDNFKDIFNLSFLTLTLLICIYEAPHEVRSGCLSTLKNHLASHSREASKLLMRLLGSNIEEQWMRSLNLAITNWVLELRESNNFLVTPSPLFSYAMSTSGMWKVQLYCPLIAMKLENSSNALSDERVNFSLKYHHLEGVIQFAHKVVVQRNCVDVMVNTDNIRFDVFRLVSETLMAERGAGAAEKHFPSRISLKLTPTFQSSVLSVSVGKSSQNPTHEFGIEKTIEGQFDAPTNFGLNISVAESTAVTLKPWKFEQSVIGDTANLNWFLHDSADGREVFSSKPSKFALAQPRAWFKNRYSKADRPFTKDGGVIFAGDEYGDSVWWKLDKGVTGKTMEWEIKGQIWLTYWPNKYRTSYNETRRSEFREILNLQL